MSVVEVSDLQGYDAILSATPTVEGEIMLPDSFGAGLPNGVRLGWAEAGSSGGVTTFTDFRVSFGEDDAVALTADQLDVYGADFTALSELFGGTLPESGGTFFERVDARGLSIDGLEGLVQSSMDPIYELMLDDFDDEALNDLDIEVEFNTYTLTADRLVIDRLTHHPMPAIGKSFEDEGAQFFQEIAQHIRSWSVDAIVMTGMNGEAAYTQYGMDVSQSYSADLIGYRGFDRGNLAATDSLGMRSSGTMPLPFPEGFDMDTDEFEMQTVSAESVLGRASWTGLELARVLDYVIAGEIPPTTETDLFSLGIFSLDNMDYQLDGRRFFSAESMVVDLAGWHWLIPDRIEMTVDELVYDYAAFAPYLRAGIMSEMDGDMAEDGWPESIDAVIELVDESRVFSAPGSGSLLWTWSAEAGDAAFTYDSVTEDFFSQELAISGALPPYERWAPFLEFVDDDLSPKSMKAFDKAFEDDGRFDGAYLRLTDNGGLDTLFNLAVAIADVLPQDDPQIQVFASYEVDDLKTMLTGMMLFGINQAAQEFAPARSYGNAMVDWIKDGGTLEFVAQPPVPITAQSAQAFEDAHGPNPGEDLILEFFGLDVRHTPPEN